MTFREVLTSMMNDYFVPMLAVVVAGSLVASLIKNSDNLSDASGDGKRWTGLLAVAKDAGYYSIIPVVVLGILKLFTSMKISL